MALHSNPLHGITQQSAAWHYTAIRYMALHSNLLHGITQQSATWHYTAICCMALHSNLLHGIELNFLTQIWEELAEIQ
jgi:5-deoxy-D-glucuronate isomerase